MSNNQSILENFALVAELDEQAAETITGGYEMFTITNKTIYDITYLIDGKSFLEKPNEVWIWTSYSGGKIKITFDTDVRPEHVQNQSYNLANGGKYEFQNNDYTKGNPYDIDLYKVA